MQPRTPTMRRGRVEQMQQRTRPSEIEIRGKDMCRLFWGLRGVWEVFPIPPQPCDMRPLDVPPERVAYDACLDAVMESHNSQEADNKDASSEQAERRTAKALDAEHRAKSQQDKPGAALRIEAAHGIQAEEALFEARHLALQSMDFALLHTCTFVVWA